MFEIEYKDYYTNNNVSSDLKYVNINCLGWIKMSIEDVDNMSEDKLIDTYFAIRTSKDISYDSYDDDWE